MTAEIPMNSRYVHNTKQRFAFYSLVRDEYTKSKQDDRAFAQFASDRLSFVCTPSQVANARRDFKIPTNVPQYAHNPSGVNATMAVRVTRIEAWIAMMDPSWGLPKP